MITEVNKLIVLTKSSMAVIKYIADILGLLMNGIFNIIEKLGIPNVGLAIILFTIVIYLVLTPLQLKQQKFSKVNALMQPEMKKIQAKYKGKRDQVSMQRQNEEMQALYAKYGVSPTGSCVQLAIQLPILFALYQVIYHIPGYITSIGDKLTAVAETSGFSTFFLQFVESLDSRLLNRNIGSGATENIVDTLYNLSTDNWTALLSDPGAAPFKSVLENAHEYIHRVTYFLGLNISDSPSILFMSAWKDKSFLMILVAILIPVLAYATQVLNFKLMPQAKSNNNKKNEPDTMDATMKSMNTVMPIMSAFICFTLPVGIGIYWIAGALVRGAQQFVINKYFDKVGMEKIIEKGRVKAEEKRRKKGAAKGQDPSQIARSATKSTRSLDIESRAKSARNNTVTDYSNRSDVQYKADSIAAKANMVKGVSSGKKNKKR